MKRAPLSHTEIFDSTVWNALRQQPHSERNPGKEKAKSSGKASVAVLEYPDFGTWLISEIQLCQMHGRNPDTGAYISVGRLRL